MSSLRASATIMVFRVGPRASAVRAEPLRQGAVLLKADKAPGEFNHAAAHPRVAGSCQTFLPPPGPAFVRRPGKTGIASHGSSVSQIAPQDFVHEHICGLDAHAEHAR